MTPSVVDFLSRQLMFDPFKDCGYIFVQRFCGFHDNTGTKDENKNRLPKTIFKTCPSVTLQNTVTQWYICSQLSFHVARQLPAQDLISPFSVKKKKESKAA